MCGAGVWHWRYREGSTGEGTASISATVVHEESCSRPELQDIAFFIKAPAVLLCKLKVERFQLMMIVKSTNIDCCLHYRSGVLVKFL